MAKPTCTTTYSPTCASGMYCRHTFLRTPPKSTSDISVPSTSAMLRTRPGTARHMRGLLSINSAGGADDQLAEGDTAVVGGNQPRAQHGEAAFAQAALGGVDQQRVLEDAAAERHHVQPGLSPTRVRQVADEDRAR